ncbi:hypothetical protein MLD38_011894 [Melastoma candidum]|uniref:Uncharacterized protein n=1 Tax=Melastoma candidum TaxID=119954 RepID=A0ACB9R840_9MYRT|nr:hypothetical protein MLD38_011894 [Melastoma candidum]
MIRASTIGFLLPIAVLAASSHFSRFSEGVGVGGACHFPAIFNFGDSNSDTGGLSAVFGQAPAPNGETHFGGPAGRYCDGRLVVDFIAESLGLPHLSAYLDSMGTNFSHGANFATAGSPIISPNTSGFSPINLNVQLVEYSEFCSRSQIIRSRGGMFAKLMPKEEYLSRGLYTFDVGQNDLTAGLKMNETIEQIKAGLPEIIARFSDVVTKVYAQGGRSFWVHNTGPLGCLIYILDRFGDEYNLDEYGCAIEINEMARHFNSLLKESVEGLRRDLPEASITYVDIYTVKYDLITRAEKHGFEQPFVVCCGHGGKYNYNDSRRCGAKITIDGKEVVIAKSCRDPSVRVSWDGIHFTEAANRWIFKQIATGAFSDPPVQLTMACHSTIQC